MAWQSGRTAAHDVRDRISSMDACVKFEVYITKRLSLNGINAQKSPDRQIDWHHHYTRIHANFELCFFNVCAFVLQQCTCHKHVNKQWQAWSHKCLYLIHITINRKIYNILQPSVRYDFLLPAIRFCVHKKFNYLKSFFFLSQSCPKMESNNFIS